MIDEIDNGSDSQSGVVVGLRCSWLFLVYVIGHICPGNYGKGLPDNDDDGETTLDFRIAEIEGDLEWDRSGEANCGKDDVPHFEEDECEQADAEETLFVFSMDQMLIMMGLCRRRTVAFGTRGGSAVRRAHLRRGWEQKKPRALLNVRNISGPRRCFLMSQWIFLPTIHRDIDGRSEARSSARRRANPK